MKRQKWLSVIIAAVIAVMGLAYWVYSNSPRYCAAEGRVIPEEEWKVRALMAIRAKGRENLSQNMRGFLAQRLPAGATYTQVKDALSDYVRRVPLCCQIDYDDTGNFRSHEQEFTDGHLLIEKKPVADLLVFGGSENAFQAHKFEKGVPLAVTVGVTLHTIAGVSSCGHDVIIWSRG